MSLRAWIAALVLIPLLGSVVAVVLVRAKPPDLPAHVTIDCAAEDKAVTPPVSAGAHSDQDKPNRAQKLYLEGESYRRACYPVSACIAYEQACLLDPNGRYGRKAAARLRALGVVLGPLEQEREGAEEDSGGTEEQTATGALGHVAELLEAGQRALADGAYGEAERLARQALARDPQCRAAQALATRARRCLEKQLDRGSP
jgi:hypothetical protein